MIFTQLSLFSLLAVFASSAVAAMGLGGGILGGVLGGSAGSLLSNFLEPELLRKAFGGFLLLIGLR